MRAMNLLRSGFAACVLMALAGCASNGDLFVVMPHDDGSVGGVVVKKGGKDIVLDKALAAAKTGGSAPQAFTTTNEDVQQRFGDALKAQPKAPRSFMLYFEEGGTRLTAESRPVLQQIFADVASRPSAEIAVIGHTDRVGKVADNDALSRRRAQAVIDFLVTNGAKRDIMTASGRGEREPLVPTADEVAEPRNRRAEISVR